MPGAEFDCGIRPELLHCIRPDDINLEARMRTSRERWITLASILISIDRR
jgi:hypothetical protein